MKDDRLRAGLRAGPDTNHGVRAALTVSPQMRAFLADYVRRGVK